MTEYASNSLRPVAGNLYVPDSMEVRGKIRPVSRTVDGVRNGEFELVPIGPNGFIWEFKSMSKTELDWWNDLIGPYDSYTNEFMARSKTFFMATVGGTLMPAARVWDETGTLRSYAVATIDRPVWQEYFNGIYHEVRVNFAYLSAFTGLA